MVAFLFCHLPFLAGILIFLTLHLGLTLMKATASYSYEGLMLQTEMGYQIKVVIVGWVDIPMRDSNLGLRVNICLNLTHALTHSATMAGLNGGLLITKFINKASCSSESWSYLFKLFGRSNFYEYWDLFCNDLKVTTMSQVSFQPLKIHLWYILIINMEMYVLFIAFA